MNMLGLRELWKFGKSKLSAMVRTRFGDENDALRWALSYKVEGQKKMGTTMEDLEASRRRNYRYWVAKGRRP